MWAYVRDMLTYMWSIAKEYFGAYMGTGLIVIWYLAATLYLALTEKKKSIRVMFVYMPIMVLLIYFNPAVTWLVSEYIDYEIYYRMLWLLPVTAVLALTIVRICGRLEGIKRLVFGFAAAGLIMVSGSFVYRDNLFQKAENIYHVPQTVVDICDAIKVEGREVMAVFPKEMVQYVRQYSPVVCMPYGREVTVERWDLMEDNELYHQMEAEEIDAQRLAELAREAWCAYIILPEDKRMNGSLKTYDFERFSQVDGYVIYKDSTVQLVSTVVQQ